MKRIMFGVVPIIVALFVFCGCNMAQPDVIYTVHIISNDAINILLGQSSTDTAEIVCYTDAPLDKCVVDYDDKIINFDINTGVITAIGVGNTDLRISAGKSHDSVRVHVEKAVYCNPTLFKVDNTSKVIIGANQKLGYTINKGYNMGLSYTTNNPEVLDIDNEGNMYAKALGEATITVIAKLDINADGSYDTVFQSQIIQVVNARTEAKAVLCDESGEPLKQNTNGKYNLFADNDKNTNYILRVMSDCNYDTASFASQMFEDSHFCIKKSNEYVMDEFFVKDFAFYISNFTHVFDIDFCVSILDTIPTAPEPIVSNVLNCACYRLATIDDITIQFYTDATCQQLYPLNQYGAVALDDAQSCYMEIVISEQCLKSYRVDSEIVVLEDLGNCIRITAIRCFGEDTIRFTMLDGSQVTMQYNILLGITDASIEYEVKVSIVDEIINVDIKYIVLDGNSKPTHSQSVSVYLFDKNDVLLTNEPMVLGLTQGLCLVAIDFDVKALNDCYYVLLVSDLGYFSEKIEIILQ